MYKQFCCALALALFSGLAFAGPPAGTIGIGVAHSESTTGSSNTIYVPITLRQGLWVEPFFSFAHEEDKASEVETTAATVGVGLFRNFFATEHTRAYFGGRIGYTQIEVDPPNASAEDESGLLIQPVIGFGYEPVDNILFGAEAFIAYRDSDITGTETYGTGTSLFVRYYFAQ